MQSQNYQNKNAMQLGNIHLNKTEQAKQILAMRRIEQGAIDELGIGSIRDALADEMFPGISTLHQHAKYFVLLPQVYQKVWEKARRIEDVSLRQVQQMIIEEEISMTRHLSKNTPNAPGITGADSLRSNNQFVKYDPTYIYNSALRTYGFLQLDQRTTIASAIRSYALQWQSRPEQMRTESADVANDANETISYRPFCEFPRELGYKFPEECHLDVNFAERDYIKEHMLTAIHVRHSLLGYLLEHDEIKIEGDFFTLDRDEFPPQFRDMIHRSCEISEFVYLLFLRYNVILSNSQDEEIVREWEECYSRFKENQPDIIASLFPLHSGANRLLNNSLHFVEDCYHSLLKGDLNQLKDLIVSREIAIKSGRRKINNPDFEYKMPIHHYYLSYRWETVRLMLQELRKEDLWQKS